MSHIGKPQAQAYASRGSRSRSFRRLFSRLLYLYLISRHIFALIAIDIYLFEDLEQDLGETRVQDSRVSSYSFYLHYISRLFKKLMAACKRLAQFGANSAICFGKYGRINPWSSSIVNTFEYRQLSQLGKSNGKRAFLVNSSAVVRGLEAQGVPSKHAEAITAAITGVLNDCGSIICIDSRNAKDKNSQLVLLVSRGSL